MMLEHWLLSINRLLTIAPGPKPAKAYWNWLRSNWERFRRTSRIQAKPLKLTLDSINRCQLKCPLCPTGLRVHDRGQAIFELEEFDRLMEEVGDYVFFMDFFNWGEPLLNKHLEDLLASASRRGISTTISTNLSLPLSDDRIRKLIQSGLSEMIVSVDGASQETYQKYRRGGNLEKVISNVRRIVEIRDELGSRTPWINWRFLVFRFNEHELDSARQTAQEIGVDRFTAAAPWLDEGGFYPKPEEDCEVIKNWVPSDPQYRPGAAGEPLLQRRQAKRKRCDWHYMSTAINADGQIGACCVTYETKDDFASLADGHSYMEAVNNEAFRSIRDRFAGRREEPTDMICEECDMDHMFDYSKSVNRKIAASVLKPLIEPLANMTTRVMRLKRTRPRTA